MWQESSDKLVIQSEVIQPELMKTFRKIVWKYFWLLKGNETLKGRLKVALVKTASSAGQPEQHIWETGIVV